MHTLVEAESTSVSFRTAAITQASRIISEENSPSPSPIRGSSVKRNSTILLNDPCPSGDPSTTADMDAEYFLPSTPSKIYASMGSSGSLRSLERELSRVIDDDSCRDSLSSPLQDSARGPLSLSLALQPINPGAAPRNVMPPIETLFSRSELRRSINKMVTKDEVGRAACSTVFNEMGSV